MTCPPTTSGTPISASNGQIKESVSKDIQSPKGTRSGSPSSPPPGASNQSTPSSSRCTSAQTNRNTCTPLGSKQRISSAGHTPYSRQTLISPSSESNGSRPHSSSHSSIRSTPKPSTPLSDRKPSSSGSSRAILSAAVTARTSGSLMSRQSDGQSLLGSSQSQRTCSQNCSRPESRQGNGQQSVMSQDDRTTYPSSYIESRPPSSQVSRPPSQASIALTSSTKSGIKSRGVQCSHI